MSADMYIHALVYCGIKDYAMVCKNHIGSRFEADPRDEPDFRKDFEKYRIWRDLESKRRVMAEEKVYSSPSVWIGEVSWLKFTLTGCEEFVPQTCRDIAKLIGEKFPILTDDLSKQILETFNYPEHEVYRRNSPETVEKWLDKWKGCRLFSLNW